VDWNSQSSRIVVLRDAADGRRSEALEILSGWGGGAVIDLVSDLASCRARCASVAVDLLVLESGLRPIAGEPIEALAAIGPPLVVLLREADAAGALEVTRRGALDCVQVGIDAEGRLPLVVQEQARHGQRDRAHEAAERRIVELEDYTENIIQHMNSALVVVNAEGAITQANATAEEVLEAAAGSLLGGLVDDWFDPEGGEPSLIARTLGEGVSWKGEETVVRRSDGALVPVGISCAPMTNREGQRSGAVAIFQDLTEVKQLELQVLQSEKMASIGKLAAGVAHEINNPTGFIHANLHQMNEYLTDLRGVWKLTAELSSTVTRGEFAAAQSVADELEALSRELDIDFVYSDFAKAVQESREGSERIRHIVQDLRDFSYRDSGDRVDADINECVDSTASIVWTMMKHSVVLEKEYGELPEICCYPMQLKQVFMNLLVNAYQSIEALAKEAEPGTIWVRTRIAEGGVEIEIEDTGEGISPENLGRIFDPFFTTKEVGVGTGLGLSTSYSIVERHAGQISVTSEVGRGTCFRVWLPERAPAPEPADG
jgi:PAS domain S-box-containing protein